MPSTCCCVPGCSNKGGHVFPKDATLRKEWVRVVRRDKWSPNLTAVVCKLHFKPEDYLHETFHGTKPLSCRLKKNAVPSVFFWTKEDGDLAKNRKERLARRRLNYSAVKPRATTVGLPSTSTEDPIKETEVDDEMIYGVQEIDIVADDVRLDVSYHTTATQTNPAPATCEASVQTSVRSSIGFSVENFRNDNRGIHFYTGLESFEKLKFVLDTLGEGAYHLTFLYGPCNMQVLDQFFVTLIKLRLNKTYFELSRMFLVNESDVYNIFCTWIKFMHLQWRELYIFPSKQCINFYAPTDFRNKFPSTRVIVDGTECPIKKPKKPTAQQSTFSTYKNRNTVKTLIGTSPGGMVTYVSECYGGSTSDRQIIERSDLPLQCKRGDSIMADKGFDVQDLLAPYGIHVNMPAFFSKTNRIPGKVIRNDRKIASKRVHVERSIGLGKTYKMLTKPMCHSEVLLSSDIVFICFMLCNFRKNIVGPNA